MTTREQRAENLANLAARKLQYGEWLMGEEVLALRKKYGLTQQQASEVFGKGKIAFSRYENETSYPDLAMTRLMRLALDDARVMKRLAGLARLELPLVAKRLGDDAASAIAKFSPTVQWNQIVVDMVSCSMETMKAFGLDRLPDTQWWDSTQITEATEANDRQYEVQAAQVR